MYVVELPCGYWEYILGPLEEQPVHCRTTSSGPNMTVFLYTFPSLENSVPQDLLDRSQLDGSVVENMTCLAIDSSYVRVCKQNPYR